MPAVAAAPVYAAAASSGFLRPVRSATAPTSGITRTATTTDSETAYANSEPARTGMPSGWTKPSASAAVFASFAPNRG